MTTVLHIASSSNLQSSVTRQIGSLTIEGLKKAHENIQVIEHDLVKENIPHISPEFVTEMFSGNADAPELKLSNQFVDELLSSDILVIEAPMYNFGIPSALKAWIDHIVRAGKTFQYGENGPEGLIPAGKEAILILGRGGVYSEGPYKAMDYQESYLRAVLGFIGITKIESVYIEGVAMGPEKTAEALEEAQKQVSSILSKAA